MPDIKKLGLAGMLAILSVFLFYLLGNVFIGTTATSAQTMNATLTTAGYSDQGDLIITIFTIVLYGLALAPLGIAIYLITDAVKS